MRRFRRRRPNAVWMPVYGNSAGDGNTASYAGGNTGVIPVDVSGEITVEAVPVTFDYTESAWQVQTAGGTNPQTLHDIVSGQEWRLRRIVGKAHITSGIRLPEGTGSLPNDTPQAVEVAAGYIVLKTDEEGDLLTDIEETNPLVQESMDDPWIWRRKWILRLGGSNHITPNYGTIYSSDYGPLTTDFPYTTMAYGSVADGPHIDQKTARVIHRQERLFLMLAVRVWNPGYSITFSNSNPITVNYNFDHRFVGSLRSNQGNRRNASR